MPRGPWQCFSGSWNLILNYHNRTNYNNQNCNLKGGFISVGFFPIWNYVGFLLEGLYSQPHKKYQQIIFLLFPNNEFLFNIFWLAWISEVNLCQILLSVQYENNPFVRCIKPEEFHLKVTHLIVSDSWSHLCISQNNYSCPQGIHTHILVTYPGNMAGRFRGFNKRTFMIRVL